MGFPRQEYWNGLLFPSPGRLPDPGIEPVSPAGGFIPAQPPGKPHPLYYDAFNSSPVTEAVSLIKLAHFAYITLEVLFSKRT